MTNYPPSRDIARLALPDMLCCSTAWDAADHAPFVRPRAGRFGRLVEVLGDRWRKARARRAVVGQLAAMSDGELADMSISRPDVHRLFDPQFAHEFDTRRPGRRMQDL